MADTIVVWVGVRECVCRQVVVVVAWGEQRGACSGAARSLSRQCASGYREGRLRSTALTELLDVGPWCPYAVNGQHRKAQYTTLHNTTLHCTAQHHTTLHRTVHDAAEELKSGVVKPESSKAVLVGL